MFPKLHGTVWTITIFIVRVSGLFTDIAFACDVYARDVLKQQETSKPA